MIGWTGSCDETWPRRRQLLAFRRVHGVEPTNNTTDQALRPAVIYEKLSFGTQSRSRTRYLERLLTLSQTYRTAGPQCLRVAGGRNAGQVQRGCASSLRPATWGRASHLESQNVPLLVTGPKQPIQINTSFQHRRVTGYLFSLTRWKSCTIVKHKNRSTHSSTDSSEPGYNYNSTPSRSPGPA